MKQAVEIILTLSATFKGSADQQRIDAKTDFAFLGHNNLFSQIYMTRPEGQSQVITRDQSISLSFAVCLGLLSANLLSLCTNQHGTHCWWWWWWCIYIALYCVLLYTQSALQSCGGVSPQPPPVCSIHLDDMTAATGQRCQCAHHTPATGGEEKVIEPIKWMGIIRRPWWSEASGGNLARTPGLHPYPWHLVIITNIQYTCMKCKTRRV